MDYGIYKNARNASWQCLIDCRVSELPVKPVRIAAHYDISCLKATDKQLNGRSGEIRPLGNEIYISFKEEESIARQRFTILHELGHYLLGHLGDTPLSRSERDCKPEEEQAADRFAADMLMPACVLWGLNIHTPEEIAALCDVSMQAAKIRAERMEILYQRNKFLTHSLEHKVFQQFQQFINNQKPHY